MILQTIQLDWRWVNRNIVRLKNSNQKKVILTICGLVRLRIGVLILILIIF